MDAMVAGLAGVASYLDDIIVCGRSMEEHNARLHGLFEKIKEYGLKVNLTKCSFLQQEVNYLGQIISAEGRRPDPMKIESIVKMPAPKNLGELRSLLGMIIYYALVDHSSNKVGRRYPG